MGSHLLGPKAAPMLRGPLCVGQAVLEHVSSDAVRDVDKLRLVMLYALRFEKESPRHFAQLMNKLASAPGGSALGTSRAHTKPAVSWEHAQHPCRLPHAGRWHVQQRCVGILLPGRGMSGKCTRHRMEQ